MCEPYKFITYVVFVYIISLVMHLSLMTNRVYQVVQSVHFLPCFLVLKVVHHIHGWMAGKLQTCFSKDTGCRNQSTLTMTCEWLACLCSYFSAVCKVHLLISQQPNPMRLSQDVYLIQLWLSNQGRKLIRNIPDGKKKQNKTNHDEK